MFHPRISNPQFNIWNISYITLQDVFPRATNHIIAWFVTLSFLLPSFLSSPLDNPAKRSDLSFVVDVLWFLKDFVFLRKKLNQRRVFLSLPLSPEKKIFVFVHWNSLGYPTEIHLIMMIFFLFVFLKANVVPRYVMSDFEIFMLWSKIHFLIELFWSILLRCYIFSLFRVTMDQW